MSAYFTFAQLVNPAQNDADD